MIEPPWLLMTFVLASSIAMLVAEGRLQMSILLVLLPALLVALLAVNGASALTSFEFAALLAVAFVSLAAGGVWMQRSLDSSDNT